MIFCVLRWTWSFVFIFVFVFVCIYVLCFCAATDFSVNKDLYIKFLFTEGCSATCISVISSPYRPWSAFKAQEISAVPEGGAENASLENAGLEKARPNCKTGNRGTGKREMGLVMERRSSLNSRHTENSMTLIEEGWLPLSLVQKLLKSQIKTDGIA